ncbi:retinol dehydrogenase 8-like [Diadema antillarum]|uniref:retinol dehydrogenase 8-like n=1 Tax=Diadema antillarum TaxID=105358 RepID=UPI003A84C139
MAPQVVLLTGCSSGLGFSMARRLAQDPDQRYLVIATDKDMAGKAELVAAVGDTIDKTIFIKEMDITKDEDITRVVDDAIKTYERIDILINVAGVATMGLPERMSRARIESIFNVNTIGTIRLTLAVLPNMKHKKAGKIISVTSVGGVRGVPYGEVYSASKFAVEGFFESLLPAVKSFNIRVCMVEPAQIKTRMATGVWSDIETQISDETIHDIDRRQLRCVLNGMKWAPVSPVDDVVDAIMTKCVQDDYPVFRHLVAHPLIKGSLEGPSTDLTGEKTIALLRKMFGAE